MLSALFLSLGFILPMLTGQIPVIGKALLPMHIPVLLCGLICGSRYGAAIGFILPIFRSLLFSVPTMYPTAIAVAFEMAVYGLFTGLLYCRSKRKTIICLYSSLIIAMICGRIVRCITEMALLGLQGDAFSWHSFLTGVIIASVPGIIIQLTLIPMIIIMLYRAELLNFQK